MDKTSKKILNLLKQNPDSMLWYSDAPYKALGISDEEFFRCVRYLHSLGLIEIPENQDGVHLGIQLSHISVHSAEIKRDSFFHWFLHSFIGGVVVGVTSTLAGELIIYLFVKIIPALFR